MLRTWPKASIEALSLGKQSSSICGNWHSFGFRVAYVDSEKVYPRSAFLAYFASSYVGNMQQTAIFALSSENILLSIWSKCSNKHVHCSWFMQTLSYTLLSTYTPWVVKSASKCPWFGGVWRLWSSHKYTYTLFCNYVQIIKKITSWCFVIIKHINYKQ